MDTDASFCSSTQQDQQPLQNQQHYQQHSLPAWVTSVDETAEPFKLTQPEITPLGEPELAPQPFSEIDDEDLNQRVPCDYETQQAMVCEWYWELQREYGLVPVHECKTPAGGGHIDKGAIILTETYKQNSTTVANSIKWTKSMVSSTISTHAPKTLVDVRRFASRVANVRHHEVTDISPNPSLLETKLNVLAAAVAQLSIALQHQDTRPSTQQLIQQQFEQSFQRSYRNGDRLCDNAVCSLCGGAPIHAISPYASKETKCTNIVNHVMGPEMDSCVEELCKNSKFSILANESNDQGDNRFMAILVRVFDPQIQRVATKFLAMPVCNIGNVQNLFIDRDIPWGKCIGFRSDN
ncbi:LOW QUALITY PROTEIN: hypothetical protein MAR_034670 [Mya arenaria]|uniref:Uncharacterized protein n=1 Tax=Mya arenaria TaxID=6604 RepID=A0ABY7EKQ5_MYAAR|nr:LOW QUALITY PROTEIN: hypothetical protein MAR_034670 [Mya arenaria]